MTVIKRHIGDIDRTAWENLVRESSCGNFFQTPQCYDLYAAMSFMEPFIVAVEDDGIIQGLMMGYIQKDGGCVKSYLSRRAIVNGGPLIRDGSSVLATLLTSCRTMLRGKAIYLEIRNFEDYSAFRGVFGDCGFKYKTHLNFHVDTSSVKLMEENLGKSRKRDIKYSLREGVQIVEADTEASVDEYYSLLSELYKTKVGTPLFPLEFFRYLLGKEYARILLVEHLGKVVGGSVCVCLPDVAVYEWFVCGADGRAKNVFPSTVATYAGIRYACDNGFPRFDMMGAGTPDSDYGVRDFKAKFGGALVEHGRFIHVFNPVLYEVGKLGVKFMKRGLHKK